VNKLHFDVSGTAEVQYVGEMQSGDYGKYVSGFLTVYEMKGGKKSYITNVGFRANKEVAEKVDGLRIQKGEVISFKGQLSSKKEGNLKNASGYDLYVPYIRLEDVSVPDKQEDGEESPRDNTVPIKQKPKPKYNQFAIIEDDLPF